MNIEKYKQEIERRYKRRVIAHPDGAVVHDGDCSIYNRDRGFCSCGLLHMLERIAHVAKEIYPPYEVEHIYEYHATGQGSLLA